MDYELKPKYVYKEANIYDEYEIYAYYHDGDPEKRRMAIQATCEMMDLYIHSIIEKNFYSFQKDKEDLYQASILRVMEDLQDFDPDKGKMTTWFKMSILNACNQFLSEEYNHSTPYFAKNVKEVKRAIRYFEGQGNDKWTATDIVEYTKLSRKNVDDALERIEQIEMESGLEFEADTKNAAKERGIISPEDELILRTKERLIEEAMETLTEEEKQLITLRYMTKDKKMSLHQIAKIMGEKVPRVQKKIHRAIRKLRANKELREYIHGENSVARYNKERMNFIDEQADDYEYLF